MKKSTTQLSPEEALRLVDRYFEAETSEEEEARLRDFLVTADEADGRFDEVRAVMGVALCPLPEVAAFAPAAPALSAPDRQRSRSCAGFSVLIRRTVVAASFLLIAGVATTGYLYRANNRCIAYINGQKVTDKAQVEQAMHDVLQQVSMPDGNASSIEEQMSNMFGPLE